MKITTAISLAALLSLFICPSGLTQPAPLTVKAADGKVRVEIDGKLFTELLTKDQRQPLLYPLVAPGGVNLARQFPLEKAREGEASDHPHHTALWYTHGNVNGADFWHDKACVIRQSSLDFAGVEKGRGVIRSQHVWEKAGKPICSDARQLQFFQEADGSRWIDFQITLKATHGDVVFGDTKEGSMAVRTHPELRLKGKVAKGTAINSEGVTGKAVWGKHAKWVCYAGEVEGQILGLSVLDHPTNPRHPTTWHARDYGLLAANPYGLSDFEKKPKGTGDLKIASGEDVTFRYRFVFHKGDAKAAGVEGRYAAFAKED